MRRFVACTIVGLASASACVVEEAVSPSVFVLEDIGDGPWAAVSTGYQHGCAIDRDGRAWCWGSNADYQLGVDLTPSLCGADSLTPCSLVPIPVNTGRSFIAISAGRSHTCALSTDSVPFCWGRNSEGQLGTGHPTSSVMRIPGAAPMISISAGSAHSCGVRTDNQLVCWGSNRFGAVGTGSGLQVAPSVIGGNQRFTSVEASDERTCARTLTGRVMCWGALWSFSSGDTNYSTIRANPTFVSGLGAMSRVDVGPSSACSLDATGFGWCWETNVHGESGAGPGQGSFTPRRIATDEEFASISAGSAHACAVAKDGAAWCWGSNRNFQLGSTTTETCGVARSSCSTRPTRVSGRQKFTTLSAGLGTHVCGVTDRFNLYCWGAGSFGQRGDGRTTELSRIPRLAAGVHKQ